MQSHAIRFSSTSSVNSLKERGEERAREKVHVVVVSDPSVSLVSTSSMRRTERERNSEELCVHAVVLCSWRLASQISEPYLFHAGLQPVGRSPYVSKTRTSNESSLEVNSWSDKLQKLLLSGDGRMRCEVHPNEMKMQKLGKVGPSTTS